MHKCSEYSAGPHRVVQENAWLPLATRNVRRRHDALRNNLVASKPSVAAYLPWVIASGGYVTVREHSFQRDLPLGTVFTTLDK